MKQTDTGDHKLTLAEVLGMLLADTMIDQAQADALIASRRGHRHDSHPLTLVSEQSWKSLLVPNKLMHLEALTEWMAQRTGLGYFHIDPLKIDFTSVTDLMSSEYAARYGILPVKVTATEVLIKILHQELAAGSNIREHRNFLGHGIIIIQSQADIGATRHGDHVYDRVGRAANRQLRGHRVFETSPGE